MIDAKWLMERNMLKIRFDSEPMQIYFPSIHSLDSRFAQQNEAEFSLLWEKARGAQSILEIGSCFGHSLLMLSEVAGKGARIRSIDLGVLPEEAGGHAHYDVSPALNRTEWLLRAAGFDALFKIGNSHDPEVIKWAKDEGPYDLVFIDGDHSYEGVKADWENYGLLGRMVAFHDIAHHDCGVARLWSEIKELNYKTDERTRAHMGIGIVFRDKENA